MIILINSFSNFKCIGIYGGTFNPIHNGHIMVIKRAIEQCKDIEKIILMPNNMPEYKKNREILPSDKRLEMLKLIAAENNDIDVSDMEIKRGGYTYTYDTLREILNQKPELKIYFIIGSDSLVSIRKWYKYEEILRMCTLLVAQREENYNEMKRFSDNLRNDFGFANIDFLDVKPYDAASSDIRKKIHDGKLPDDILPDVIVKYIKENKLYGCE